MMREMLGREAMLVVCALQALAALCVGLVVLNVDLLGHLESLLGQHGPMLVNVVRSVMGLAGVVGLVEVVMGCESCR